MHTLPRRDFLAAGSGLLAGSLLTTATEAAPTSNVNEKPAAFKLGIVTYNVAKDWDLPTLLKICKATGIAAVECRTTHKHGVEPSLSAEDRKKVKQQFAESGVVFWGSGSVCEFHDPDAGKVKKQIDDCKAFIKLVSDLGGKGVKVRPNGLPKTVPVEKTLEQIGKSLIECGKVAEDAGIEIWVEVHGAGTQEPANMKTIMEQCGHKSVGVTWNSNPTDIKNGSVMEAFKMLQPWIKSCHINELYKDSSGAYPYRELFKLFREMGYDRYTLMEIGKTPPTADSGEELVRYYKALWTELVK